MTQPPVPAHTAPRVSTHDRQSSGYHFAIIGSRGYPSTYGGYETLVRYLARHMVSNGHQVTVYCREESQGRREWVEDGVRCVVTRGTETKQLSTLTFGATSCAHAARRRVDAALVLNVANGFWMPGLRAARIPFAVNTDGLEWKRAKWSRLGRGVFRAGAELTARMAPVLVCDSVAIGRVWQDEFKRSSEFIPYGGEVHGPLPDESLRGMGLEPGAYALAVARLVPENNVELTLDAIEALGPDAPMTVVVGDANFPSPTTSRLERLQAAGRVRWLGHVADQDLLAALWQHAGVYVHGHSVGGTNPALLQALGAGAPTLALDTDFNREVLPFDDQLYPHDATALGRRIVELCRDGGERQALAARGRQLVGERYRWEDVCGAYTGLLVRLAQARAT